LFFAFHQERERYSDLFLIQGFRVPHSRIDGHIQILESVLRESNPRRNKILTAEPER